MSVCVCVYCIVYLIAGLTNDCRGGLPINPSGTDGFAALKGWDPATGWGTPNFEKLSALI